jgi:excisionase family DNA binding protein
MRLHEDSVRATVVAMASADVEWLSTQEASRRLGITTRTLYRFVDQGDLPAYRMGRVIRLKATDIDTFIDASRIEPGTLEHLYPDTSPKS